MSIIALAILNVISRVIFLLFFRSFMFQTVVMDTEIIFLIIIENSSANGIYNLIDEHEHWWLYLIKFKQRREKKVLRLQEISSGQWIHIRAYNSLNIVFDCLAQWKSWSKWKERWTVMLEERSKDKKGFTMSK